MKDEAEAAPTNTKKAKRRDADAVAADYEKRALRARWARARSLLERLDKAGVELAEIKNACAGMELDDHFGAALEALDAAGKALKAKIPEGAR